MPAHQALQLMAMVEGAFDQHHWGRTMLSGSFSPRHIGVAAILIIASTSADAWAQSHPLTLRMSCAQAQGLVASQRAIVLNTGPFTTAVMSDPLDPVPSGKLWIRHGCRQLIQLSAPSGIVVQRAPRPHGTRLSQSPYGRRCLAHAMRFGDLSDCAKPGGPGGVSGSASRTLQSGYDRGQCLPRH